MSARSHWSARSPRRPRSSSATCTSSASSKSAGSELARKVEQLEALSEVGGLVSSSLVLDEVLSNIIMNAVRFSGCDGGSIMEYVEDERCFSVRSAYASSPELLAKLRTIRVDLETTLVGRSALEGHPIAVADLGAVELDPHLRLLHDDGWRSMIAVPVLRGERIIGALVVRRRTTGGFPTRQSSSSRRSRAVGARRVERAAVPRARDQECRAAGGESAQVRVPCEHVARAAHAAQVVPLRTMLENGDQVEILASEAQHRNPPGSASSSPARRAPTSAASSGEGARRDGPARPQDLRRDRPAPAPALGREAITRRSSGSISRTR